MGYMESLLNQIERTAAALKSAYSALVRCGVYPDASSTVEQLAGYIDDVRSTAYNAGINASEAYAAGLTAGINSEYDRYWDSYQSNGARASYSYAFAGKGWTDETYNPKYKTIQPTSAYMMFAESTITDIMLNSSVCIDTSKCSTFMYMFYLSAVERVGTITVKSNCSLSYMFYGCSYLHTIDLLQLPDDGSATFSSTFASCTRLVNLQICGQIGKNGFSVASCSKLSHDSLIFIIDALADKSGDTSGTTWTVTLGSTNKSKLSDEELSAVLQKGWVIS